MNRCTCDPRYRGGPATWPAEDPCGHADTSEGCPVHDPSLVDADDLARAVGALLEDYATSALADQLGVDEDDAPALYALDDRPLEMNGETWITLCPEDSHDGRLWEFSTTTGRVIQTMEDDDS